MINQFEKKKTPEKSTFVLKFVWVWDCIEPEFAPQSTCMKRTCCEIGTEASSSEYPNSRKPNRN